MWAVTWTNRSGVVGTARMASEAEADDVVASLNLAFSCVAKWNPAGKCVWANGVQDNATLSDEKGCTHPAEEPCFPVARTTERWREDRT